MAAPKEERTVEIIVNGVKANASLKEMGAAAAVLSNQFNKMSADDPGRTKLLADWQAMRGRIADVKAEINGVTETTSSMKQAFATAFGFLIGGGIEAAIGKVFELGKSIFDTTAKFQSYESVMTNALGDKSKAQQAMRDIQDMAAKTPFSVDELTGSFIKFVNRGLNPSMAEMTKMADIAASQGKSFDQLTEAVLDAGGGEFERLKEFGIKASKSGDEVSLSFKGVNQTVKNTPEAINGAIMAFGAMKGVAGSTAAISATLEGQLSNLGDTSDQLKLKVGEGLNPVFTLLLGLFGRFLDWIGRFIDAAAPLKSLFTEVGSIIRDFYREIGDVLEGLGLFSEKTDTVKIAVEVLKVALTLLLIPLRVAFQAAKGMVDVFVDWYNKSELLRGVLGGLGAVVVELFTTVKDNAIKILGGVGDILVGIFSLDKDKIIAGFKSAMAATADVMLESGNKAADAFAKGYEANKNNHITRTVKVKTQESVEAAQTGTDLKSDPNSSADAAAEKKRLAAEKKAAAEALKVRLAEIEAEKHHQEMLLNLREAASIARDDERGVELAKIYLDGQRKIVALEAAEKSAAARLTGTAKQQAAKRVVLEKELAAEVALVKGEVYAKQQEKEEKYLQEDLKLRTAFINDQVGLMEEEADRKQGAYEVMFNAGLLSQQAADDAIYQAKQAAFERELALIEASLGKESDAYKKVQSAQLKGEIDNNKRMLADREKAQKAKQQLARLELQTAGDVLSFGLDILEQDKEARLKHHALYVALAAAKVIVDGITEVQKIWEYSADFGLAGTIIAGVQTALAVARTTIALTKLSKPSEGGAGFAKGGATGTGAGLAVSPMGQLMLMSGMSVGGDGRLQDGSGFAVAGVVHEDEYVVPKWQLQDPQTAAVVQWLEARRMRGFADGGPTTGSGAQLPVAAASPSTDGELTYAVQAQMLDVLREMSQRLAGVETWQRELRVVNNLQNTQAGLDELKQVKYNSAIRSK